MNDVYDPNAPLIKAKTNYAKEKYTTTGLIVEALSHNSPNNKGGQKQ